MSAAAPVSARLRGDHGLRYAFLGPRGTFTETALRALAPDAAEGARPVASVDGALEAVRSGAVDRAVVPIENSVEGGVSATLDALATGGALLLVGEVLVPVTFVLAAPAGAALADVRRVGSHPHGLAQCRGWLAAHLPGATTVPALSTAASAQALAAGSAPYDAALCAEPAARAAGLEVLASGVGDNASAVTRFVVAAPPGHLPEPTGADKTTLVVDLAEERSGALVEMLEQFATRGVNLTRIESRPSGDALGRYRFSIDAEGHVADPRVGEALSGVRRTAARVVFLGSYPRADGLHPSAPPGTADADFRAASQWLAQLRAGGAG